ncbi:MAG TPA: universal stress protein [Polyangiaceae bacterium]|nr:universal stress protein [Polyangiaceae bacterium]
MAGRPVLNRSGDFLSVVAETAKVLKPAVIAIPELSGHTGRSVRGFALECGVPVLVAREELESKVILAASDLAHPSFPVLRAAALLSASHRVRVVFLHNLCPTPSDGARTSASLERCLPSVLDRLEDLTLAANAFNIESDNVVTTGPDVDESLMSVIQRERPDIVIIGARDRRQPHSTKAPLAQTVYDETAPSVVVVPLDHLRASHAPLPDHGSS